VVVLVAKRQKTHVDGVMGHRGAGGGTPGKGGKQVKSVFKTSVKSMVLQKISSALPRLERRAQECFSKNWGENVVLC